MTAFFRAAVLARVRLSGVSLQKDADSGDTTSVEDARSQKVDAFAALIVALFAKLQAGSITEDEFEQQVGTAFDKAIGDVPPDAEQEIARLRDQAIAKARRYVEAAQLPDDDEDAPSAAQKGNWGNIIASAAWAATFAAAVLVEPKETLWEWESQEDPAVCEDCDELDGQQFTRDEIPFWPGESDFGESLPDGSACGPNCRCRLKKVTDI